MAVIRIPEEGKPSRRRARSRRSWPATASTTSDGSLPTRWPPGASAEEILEAYKPEIDRLKAQGGYVTADVVDVKPDTANLEAMLAKFRSEHWHDEDEVRFILEGRGIFFVHPREGKVFAIEVGPGDLIRVPRGTWHWFDLCAERRIRAIRLFQDPAGWTPRYTGSGVDAGFEPVCLGPALPRARVSEGPRAVLLDIEGTTTPVDFVYRVLFPYAYERLPDLAPGPRAGARGRGRHPRACAKSTPAT